MKIQFILISFFLVCSCKLFNEIKRNKFLFLKNKQKSEENIFNPSIFKEQTAQTRYKRRRRYKEEEKEEEKKIISFKKSIIAGGLSRALSQIILYPLDSLRTRAQIITNNKLSTTATTLPILLPTQITQLPTPQTRPQTLRKSNGEDDTARNKNN